MITTVGNLSTKGVSFFRDEALRDEIPQYAILNTQQNKEIEFYIGMRSRVDSVGRVGKILSLEENYRTYFIDMVQEVDGNTFRNFDHVELFEVETTFDADGFMKNLLMQFLDKEFWNVLNFISMPHMGDEEVKEIFERCMNLPGKYKFVSCDNTVDEEKFLPFNPVGYWGVGYPPEGYYKFLTDFFVDPHERDRVSMWDQWNNNQYIRRGNINKYFNFGFEYDTKNYNYLNNVVTEHKELMDYRWRMGGFDVHLEEYRVMRGSIYQKFASWYMGASLGGTVSSQVYKADERTVKYFTRIGKVELDPIYNRDRPILERLLGPLTCLTMFNGTCREWGFGESGLGDDTTIQDIYSFANPDGDLNAIETADYFKVLSAPGFVAMSNEEIQSETSYNALLNKGPHPIEAMYCIDHSFGMMGGQTIYDNGAGTEYRYSLRFKTFLEQQGWTLDDFISLYSVPINDRIEELMKTLVLKNEPVRVRDFSEFYSKDMKAPFDGIEHYIPVPLQLQIGNAVPRIKVSKKRVEFTPGGEEIIHNVGEETLPANSFTLGIDKDEFVSSITVDSLSVLLSRFMTTKVKIRFKDGIPNLDQVKVRLFTSDFTYMNERELFIS